jgi:hypothetical protein
VKPVLRKLHLSDEDQELPLQQLLFYRYGFPAEAEYNLPHHIVTQSRSGWLAN